MVVVVCEPLTCPAASCNSTRIAGVEAKTSAGKNRESNTVKPTLHKNMPPGVDGGVQSAGFRRIPQQHAGTGAIGQEKTPTENGWGFIIGGGWMTVQFRLSPLDSNAAGWREDGCHFRGGFRGDFRGHLRGDLRGDLRANGLGPSICRARRQPAKRMCARPSRITNPVRLRESATTPCALGSRAAPCRPRSRTPRCGRGGGGGRVHGRRCSR